MNLRALQERCELGQRRLMEMDYLAAEAILSEAADFAWYARDFDTLSRVYLPLQEARRQRRQRAGEGIICLDLVATDANHQPDPEKIVDQFPHGQLLVAGWASLQPALEVRRLQGERGLYLETFLAAVYPTDSGNVIVIVPFANSILDFSKTLPAQSLAFLGGQLPRGVRAASAETYSYVMHLWERLHTPFLKRADAEPDRIKRIEAYRRTIEVDYACELAHQNLAETARQLSRANSDDRPEC